MSTFSTIPISPKNIDRAIQVFAHAMNFTIDVEQSILDSAKMFLNHTNLTGVCLTYDSQIVGLGGIIPMAGNTAWIPYVGIDPEFQGQGGGRVILENLIQLAKENNWKSLELVASKAGYPVYRRLNFRTDFPVASFEIKSIENDHLALPLQVVELSQNQNFPDWLLELDRSIMGIDRSNIMAIHPYDKVHIIIKSNEGYGILYGKRIGPIIAKSKEIARDIISEGFKLGGETVILINEPERIKFFKESMLLQMVQNTDTTKMTFGEPIKYKKDWIHGLRSMAHG